MFHKYVLELVLHGEMMLLRKNTYIRLILQKPGKQLVLC
jgi:hypothetical protein